MPSAKRFPRLDQLLASLGYGSRKQIQHEIKDGLVEVEGFEGKLKPESRVDPAAVRYDGEPLDEPDGLLVLLNKPVGYACTHADNEGATIYELLPARWSQRNPKLVSIGRLDKDTSGLLVLTDQHELVHRMTSPKHHVDKVYEAEIESPLRPEAPEILASGKLTLSGEDKPCLPAKIEVLAPDRVRLTLREGRYHQVRRMLGAVGSPVKSLHRTHFGPWSVEGIEDGDYELLDLSDDADSEMPE